MKELDTWYLPRQERGFASFCFKWFNNQEQRLRIGVERGARSNEFCLEHVGRRAKGRGQDV